MMVAVVNFIFEKTSRFGKYLPFKDHMHFVSTFLWIKQHRAALNKHFAFCCADWFCCHSL